MDIKTLVSKQKTFFESGKTLDIDFRLQSLEKLKSTIKENEQKIMEVLKVELNKSELEAYSTEIGIVLSEISFIQKHLKSWVKPKKVKTPLTHFGASSYIYSDPYGVALIIAPWNYPFQLAMAPLVGAIAAGNCAVIKPSELTPKTSAIIAELIAEVFSEEYIAVVQGGVETSQELLHEPFDTIFFTGSVAVGKIVMEAAAKQLIPVTLELGGKSPCIVHEDAKIKLAAKRIAWGKFINAGQTCVAPDYVYLHKKVRDEFFKELKLAIQELYGERPLENPDYTHIVNQRHYDRLISYMEDGEILIGGNGDRDNLILEPTVLTNITWEDSVMQEEIFGPILPILEYDHLNQVIEGIRNHPKPLALYLFSESSSVIQKILSYVTFGGGCINDTIYHLASPYLPFGGVGNSGMGAYHGRSSFDAFSHKKSLLKQTTLFDLPMRYPNFKNGLKVIKMLLK
ncbi:MAG: aldehyde dehydrogenase [Syntrophomonadaceae bacterium]|nr:aldehyde dehydrogenase [Syntrophomonadaceae bacterium]